MPNSNSPHPFIVPTPYVTAYRAGLRVGQMMNFHRLWRKHPRPPSALGTYVEIFADNLLVPDIESFNKEFPDARVFTDQLLRTILKRVKSIIALERAFQEPPSEERIDQSPLDDPAFQNEVATLDTALQSLELALLDTLDSLRTSLPSASKWFKLGRHISFLLCVSGHDSGELKIADFGIGIVHDGEVAWSWAKPRVVRGLMSDLRLNDGVLLSEPGTAPGFPDGLVSLCRFVSDRVPLNIWNRIEGSVNQFVTGDNDTGSKRCLSRNRYLVQLREQLTPDEQVRWGAAVLASWNNLTSEERKAIAPRCSNRIPEGTDGRKSVKKIVNETIQALSHPSSDSM